MPYPVSEIVSLIYSPFFQVRDLLSRLLINIYSIKFYFKGTAGFHHCMVGVCAKIHDDLMNMCWICQNSANFWIKILFYYDTLRERGFQRLSTSETIGCN